MRRTYRHLQCARSCVLLFALAGCREAERGPVPADRWPEALDRFQSATSFYAYALVADGEDGRQFYAEVADGAQCASGSNVQSGWVLSVQLSGVRDGRYVVSPDDARSASVATARVVARKLDDAGNETAQVVASEGMVEVSHVPQNVTAWQMSPEVSFLFDGTFPQVPVRTTFCRDSSPANAAMSQESVCTCERLDGSTTQCVSMMGADCCRTQSEGAVAVSLSLTSKPCAALCQWTNNVNPARCRELEPP